MTPQAAAGHCHRCGVETFYARPCLGGEMVELDAAPDAAPHENGTVRIAGDPRSTNERPVAYEVGPLEASALDDRGEALYRYHECGAAA